MPDRTFAPWVEPIAAKLRDNRREIVVVARSMPDAAWDQPSPNEVWTFKDLLAHLATGDWVCQGVLTMMTKGTDFSIGSPDGGNMRNVDERRDTSVDNLIAEVEKEGEETQELLSLLGEDDEHLTPEGAPMNLGQYLRMFPGHDEQHLAQLRTAIDSRS